MALSTILHHLISINIVFILICLQHLCLKWLNQEDNGVNKDFHN